MAWGLVYSPADSGYRMTRQINLSRFGGVFDMDPETGTLLVRTKADMFPKWGLLDPATQQYKSLGYAKAWGFFLDPQLAKGLGDDPEMSQGKASPLYWHSWPECR